MKKDTLINAKCVHLACERLNIEHRFYDDNNNFMSIHLDKPYFFVNCSTPFNNDGINKICADKEFSYKLLKDFVNMPKTVGFFDPDCQNQDYRIYAKQKNHKEIFEKIIESFSMPVIIKMNSGSRGTNVFLCKNELEMLTALGKIYDKDSSAYDYVALAQEYIRVKKEYRVIVFEEDILLMYEKDFSDAQFVGNLSPLHYENSKAVYVEDDELASKISNFIKPIFGILDIQFAGLDIVFDENNSLYLIELNVHPGFSYFVRDNGEGKIVDMYEKILRKMMSGLRGKPLDNKILL